LRPEVKKKYRKLDKKLYREVTKNITFTCPIRGVVSEEIQVKVYDAQKVPDIVHVDQELTELLENTSLEIETDAY